MASPERTRVSHRALLASSVLLCVGFNGKSAAAFNYQFDNGVDIRFDNTVQYSLLERASPASSYLSDQINANDGDNNLRSGVVSNRLDLMTKLDISYKGFGFDTTADTFYDWVYNQDTQNDPNSPTYNPANTPPNKFTDATRTQAGRDIQLRNLFVYGSDDVDGIPVTVRVGRLVNIFGESLFFAGNGIGYGTAPIDIARATSVPNTQAKDLFLPVGQFNISAQLTNTFSFTAYYQFEWLKANFEPEGSYFSTTDAFDSGGQRIIAVPVGASPEFPPNTGGYLYRTADQKGSNTGQFGLALHYDPPVANYDLGFYALQYNDSEPQIYVHVGAPPFQFIPGNPSAIPVGTYQVVYPDHIQIYGASATTTYGPTNFAAEISARTNEPLVSSVTLLPGQTAGNGNNAAYAKGDTLHYQASAIYLGPATPLWGGSSWAGEVGGVNLLGFVKNRENFNPAYRHMALGLRTVFTADYFHVLPGLDVTVPIGLGWNFMGKAPDTLGFNATGIDRGGDLTVGIAATYLNLWTGGISYTRYISPPGRDPFADRDFVAINAERTF